MVAAFRAIFATPGVQPPYHTSTTVPPLAALGQQAPEIKFQHLLPTGGLSFRSRDGQPWRPEKGEKFILGPSLGALGTFWWRFEDLKSDLKDAKFPSDDLWHGEDDGAKAPANEAGQ